MSALIIIRGNSGSGKSSLARELQHKFGRNIMVIPQDTVRREMLWSLFTVMSQPAADSDDLQ